MNKPKMTRYAFISHMEDYMKKLLKDPLRADTDSFLKSYGIDGPVALKMLLKKSNPDDETSSILLRTEKIKDNGFDENGKRNKDTFEVSYKIPRKDYTKKIRNLFINLFEQNIVDNDTLNEGAWGYGILDNDSALDNQSEFASQCLSVLSSKISQLNNLNGQIDSQELWSNTGVLIDFLKKYKDDEIQFNDNYNYAVELAKSSLNYLLKDSNFINSWSEPRSIKSSIKKQLKDVGTLKYQKEIMNVDDPTKLDPIPATQVNEEGEGGTMGGVAGATNAQSSGQFTTPLFGKPIKKSLYVTQEQIDYIKEATATDNAGNYQYDVPMGNDDDFYKEANDHTDIMKKSWERN